YLVDIDFVKADFAKDIDLELVDTDLFSNQLEIHKKFLLEATRYESSEQSRDYMAKVAQYYDDNEMSAKYLEYTNLHRYYIFRKKASTDSDSNKPEKSKKKQKGGRVEALPNQKNSEENFVEKYNFSDVEQFKIPDMSNYDDQYSMVNSVHKLLV